MVIKRIPLLEDLFVLQIGRTGKSKPNETTVSLAYIDFEGCCFFFFLIQSTFSWVSSLICVRMTSLIIHVELSKSEMFAEYDEMVAVGLERQKKMNN